MTAVYLTSSARNRLGLFLLPLPDALRNANAFSTRRDATPTEPRVQYSPGEPRHDLSKGTMV